MNVIFIPPQGRPRLLALDADEGTVRLDQLQALVGGYIEVVAVDGQGLAIIVNEDGLNMGLPPNLRTPNGALLAGNIVIARAEGPELVGVNDEDFAKIEAWVESCTRIGKTRYFVPMPAIFVGETMQDARKQAAQAVREQPRILGIEDIDA